jgi:hypothetical protein
MRLDLQAPAASVPARLISSRSKQAGRLLPDWRHAFQSPWPWLHRIFVRTMPSWTSSTRDYAMCCHATHASGLPMDR